MEQKMKEKENLKVVDHKNIEKICGLGPDENTEEE